ncbi:MAG: hypothetical protein ABUJ92_12140 [Desulfobacterales bacterium]
MSWNRSLIRKHQLEINRKEKIKLRKHLNADTLFATVRSGFEKIQDHRNSNATIPLADALMSGFAVFSLKDPSLLAFDERRTWCSHNLMTVYNINQIPCDTALREILDNLDPVDLRPIFKMIFQKLQRGKALEKLVFMEGCYLLNLDGTGYFSSTKRHSPACNEKVDAKTGEVIGYYLQILGAAIVHPDYKVVIPICPEPINKQDGIKKNDCERNAAKRFLADLRREHPHLPLIINEDALSSNAPHIADLEKYNLHYILGVKEGDHTFLFQYVDTAIEKGEATEFTLDDTEKPHIRHSFRFLNGVPLNKSNQDTLVNFIEYWEENTTTGKTQRFCWITDFIVTDENVFLIMRGGRARWKIENETFNTLKNQGYGFGHNYGLGKNNLSTVFVLLMMLAFLVDQALQLCCVLFNEVWKKVKSKRQLWEDIRSMFRFFNIDSMESLYLAILSDIKVQLPDLSTG